MKVLVLGDAFLDCYIMGTSERLSPEAPVPVVNIGPSSHRWSLGGAANVAANLASLGAKVTLAACTAFDAANERMKGLLREYGVAYEPCGYTDRTTTKTRVFSGNQQVVRIDDESTRYKPSYKQDMSMTDKILGLALKSDAVVISDYGKGALNRVIVGNVIREAGSHKIPVFVDPKPTSMHWYREATYITPNLKEAKEFRPGYDDPSTLADHIMGELETSVLLTLGKDGLLFAGEEVLESPSQAREVYDVSGAGDVVLAVFAYCIMSKQSVQASMDYANKAAGVAVSKIGTYVVKPEDL